jgi:alkylation response protein AidB-like acyl-CoA dehydrogenase
MDFALDEEQRLIAQTVRRFVDKDVRAWAADADRAGAAPARLAAVAGDLGFYLDAVPESAGGLLDGPYSHLRRALRGYELGRGCAGMAALLETNVEPALAVGRWGSAEAQQALFESLAGGGLAVTARDSRGLLAVEREGSGEALRVTGKVGPVPGLGVASHVLLASPESKDAFLALVPVSAGRREAVTPSAWRAGAWGTLVLEAAAVPAAMVLARGAAAVDAITEVMTWWKASMAARAAGVATVAMEHARKYADERVQFGRPIGTFESLIRLRDDADTGAAAARLMAFHAAWLADRVTDAPSRTAAHDAASRARVLAGDVVDRATIDAVQILGGYGFVNDYPVEKLMRDARPFAQLLGDERFDRILAVRATQEGR